ncbi:MAG: hypothetical protein J6B72_03015, partial [Clostridia bacterium]|nr:hypothetical protein [Clostridia bacterium]
GYIKGTIKNIILGTETAPININPSNSTGTAVLFGTLDDANTELVCDNVTVYANCEAAYTNVAAFIGQQKNGKAAFTNCNAYVDFDTSASGATSGDATGGFIGHLTAGVATMNRCKVDGTLLAATFVGGFVGRIKAFLSVENSACYADVKALTNYAGGVTGASVTGATMYVTNFLHLGAVEVTSANTVGGLTGNVGGSIYAVNMFTTHPNGVDNDKVSVVTDTQLASGEIAYKLRSAFGQKLGRDQAPVLNSADKVIKRVVAGGAQYENSTDVEDVMSLMYDINEELRWFGRTYTQYGKTFFNWSASGFEFRFKGSGAEAVVLSNAPGGSDTAYIKIYIDGVEQPDVVLDKKENTVVLAKNLDANTEHTIRVVKRTNARSSTAALVSLELTDGEKLAPPEQPKRLIEFVGDSITVGYATIAENQTVWSTATEDSTKTYSKQIADYFDADYMVTAISGRGIARNTGGDTNNLLPDIYGYVDQYNLPGVEYDFARKADVIVINLGTNDASGTNSSLTFEEFGTRLKAFLLDVRAKNPEAEIIYAYGMMRQKFIGTMQTVIKELQDAGDEHISFVVLENCDESSERKLNHPTAEAYISRGEVLIDEIERMTRWGEDDDENGGGNGGENGNGSGNGNDGSDSTVSGDKNDATTSPVGDATTAEPAGNATEETDKPASSGCGSNIGVSMMAATIAVGSAAILLKKKKQKE